MVTHSRTSQDRATELKKMIYIDDSDVCVLILYCLYFSFGFSLKCGTLCSRVKNTCGFECWIQDKQMNMIVLFLVKYCVVLFDLLI